MSESVGQIIDQAIKKRFSGPISKPINVEHPHTPEELFGASVSSDIGQKVVQIGIDQDSVLVVEPTTSAILAKKPKAEAYAQFIGLVKADHLHKKEIYEATLQFARQRMKFSLVAASVGFLIVLGGVVAMMLGYSTAGLVTSASGIISELVSVLFFRESRHASQRLDKTLEQLLEAEGYFRAFAMTEQLPDKTQRNQLLEAIVMKMIGLNLDRSQ